jgi:hypothetical protein
LAAVAGFLAIGSATGAAATGRFGRAAGVTAGSSGCGSGSVDDFGGVARRGTRVRR